MNDLFRNPKLARVLPQFPKNQPLQNVYSGAEIVRRATNYIRGIIGGRKDIEGLTVRGKHSEILARVEAMVPSIEKFFNAMPSLVKNLRNNTRLYTTYQSATQIASLKKGDADKKLDLLQQVLDNLNYNPDLNSLGSVGNTSGQTFSREQARWAKQVGYKEPRGKK